RAARAAHGGLEPEAEAEAGGQELVAASALQKVGAAGRGTTGAAGILQDWYFREDPAAPVSVPGTTPAHQPDVYPFSEADSHARLAALPPDVASMPEAGVSSGGTALDQIGRAARRE